MEDAQISEAWSVFINKESAKHAVLKHILPNQYGGLTATGGGAAYPFKVALRLAADFVPPKTVTRLEKAEAELPAEHRMVRRKEFDRDYPQIRKLKRIYDFRCQVCQERINLGATRYYCEAHHLRPLGRQHGGPADRSNVLILCPLHHAEFDFFLFAVLDYKGQKRKLEHMLRDLGAGESRLLVKHAIAPEHLDYVAEQFLVRYELLQSTG